MRIDQKSMKNSKYPSHWSNSNNKLYKDDRTATKKQKFDELQLDKKVQVSGP